MPGMGSKLALSLVTLTLFLLPTSLCIYHPCPLLHAYYPPPTLKAGSSALKGPLEKLRSVFDDLVKTGSSAQFGDVRPNTTSFSVILFTGDSTADSPALFTYNYTAPSTADGTSATEEMTADAMIPLGTLTQLFTVYLWLVEIGGAQWQTPITQFLSALSQNSSSDTAVDWDDVTAGALAGQMSGLTRDSFACHVDAMCDEKEFLARMKALPPYFQPYTTPLASNAAFQLLAFALEQDGSGQSYEDKLTDKIITQLGLTSSGMLKSSPKLFGNGLTNQTGEPAALGMYSTANDLARAGQAMLTSKLISPGTTRRWLRDSTSTSNLRNAVGKPWEVYHAGEYSNSSILDVSTKSGEIEKYSSYFGLAPDFNTGFAIVASDSTSNPDLNAYADIVSLALVEIQSLAAEETKVLFTGDFTNADGDSASLNITKTAIQTDPGVAVSTLVVDGVDLRGEIAKAAKLKNVDDLDMRLYPSNISNKGPGQTWIAVYQDKSAPTDADTPTCITWQDVGSLGQDVPDRFVFDVDNRGAATALQVQGKSAKLERRAQATALVKACRMREQNGGNSTGSGVRQGAEGEPKILRGVGVDAQQSLRWSASLSAAR